MVDVVSITTGEVYMTFDMIWISEMERYMKGWIKSNGLVFIEFDNKTKTAKVCEEQVYELVKKCYDDVIEDLNETQNNSEPETPHTNEIIRDWKCQAVEDWDWFPTEYAEKVFDDVYKIIDEKVTQETMAYC